MYPFTSDGEPSDPVAWWGYLVIFETNKMQIWIQSEYAAHADTVAPAKFTFFKDRAY